MFVGTEFHSTVVIVAVFIATNLDVSGPSGRAV